MGRAPKKFLSIATVCTLITVFITIVVIPTTHSTQPYMLHTPKSSSNNTSQLRLDVHVHGEVKINGKPVKILSDPMTIWFVKALVCLWWDEEDTAHVVPHKYTPWCLGGTEYHEGNPPLYAFIGKCYVADPTDPQLDTDVRYLIGVNGIWQDNKITVDTSLSPEQEITVNCAGLMVRDKIIWYVSIPEQTISPNDTVTITYVMEFPPEITTAAIKMVAKYMFHAAADLVVDLGRNCISTYGVAVHRDVGTPKLVIYDSTTGSTTTYGISALTFTVSLSNDGENVVMRLTFVGNGATGNQLKLSVCHDKDSGNGLSYGNFEYPVVQFNLPQTLTFDISHVYVLEISITAQ